MKLLLDLFFILFIYGTYAFAGFAILMIIQLIVYKMTGYSIINQRYVKKTSL